jgi:toxin ParE1/3/4
MSFRISPEAEADIETTVLFISDENPSAARRWHAEILISFERLGEMPRLGIARRDIRPDFRTLPYRNYVILYREVDYGVEIIRVIHGARQWEDLL